MAPVMVSDQSVFQPLRPVSCRRRVATAIDGTRVASDQRHRGGLSWLRPGASVMMVSVIETRLESSVKHQYSERDSHPVILLYFPNKLLMAQKNVISYSSDDIEIGCV